MQIIAIPFDRTLLVFDEDLGIPCRTVHRREYKIAILGPEAAQRPAQQATEDVLPPPTEREVGAR